MSTFASGSTLHLAPQTSALNPACPLQMIDLIQSIMPYLTDVPMVTPDKVLFTDGRSFVQDGIRYAGAAVVT